MIAKHRKSRGITNAEILKAAAAPGVLGASAYAAPRILATLYKPGVSTAELKERAHNFVRRYREIASRP